MEIALAAMAGGFTALLVVSLIDPQGDAAADAVWLAAGALAGIGLDRVQADEDRRQQPIRQPRQQIGGGAGSAEGGVGHGAAMNDG